MRHLATTLRSIQWIRILIAVTVFILGLFAQPFLESRIGPLFELNNIALTSFVLTAILFAVVIAIWNNIHQQVSLLRQDTEALTKYMGQRIRVLSQAEGYEEVRKRTLAANFEILKLIYYEMEDGRPAYDNDILQSPARRRMYLDERDKLREERSKDNFKYVEVLQTPSGYSLDDILRNDPIYSESCEFFVQICRQEPEFVSLRPSEVVFPNTVIIIDRSFLYLAFQTKNHDTGKYEYPFLAIVIEDPNSEAVKDMVKLFQRIEANSSLVTNATWVNHATSRVDKG